MNFEWKKLENALADVRYLVGGRMATISLSKSKGEFSVSIKQLALHEVLHLMLGEICDMAKNGEAEWLVMRAEHAVLRRLENVFIKED